MALHEFLTGKDLDVGDDFKEVVRLVVAQMLQQVSQENKTVDELPQADQANDEYFIGSKNVIADIVKGLDKECSVAPEELTALFEDSDQNKKRLAEEIYVELIKFGSSDLCRKWILNALDSEDELPEWIERLALRCVQEESPYEFGVALYLNIVKKEDDLCGAIHRLDFYTDGGVGVKEPCSPVAPRVLYGVMVNPETKKPWDLFNGVMRFGSERAAARTLLLLIEQDNWKDAAYEKFDQFVNSKDKTEREVAAYVLALSEDGFFAEKLNSFAVSGEAFKSQVAARVFTILEKTNPKVQRFTCFLESTSPDVRGTQTEYLFRLLEKSFLDKEGAERRTRKHKLAKAWLREELRAPVVFSAISRLLQKNSPKDISTLFSADMLDKGWIKKHLVSFAKNKDEKLRQTTVAVLTRFLSDATVETEKLQALMKELANGNEKSREALSQVLETVLKTKQSYRAVEMLVWLHGVLSKKNFKVLFEGLVKHESVQACIPNKSRASLEEVNEDSIRTVISLMLQKLAKDNQDAFVRYLEKYTNSDVIYERQLVAELLFVVMRKEILSLSLSTDEKQVVFDVLLRCAGGEKFDEGVVKKAVGVLASLEEQNKDRFKENLKGAEEALAAPFMLNWIAHTKADQMAQRFLGFSLEDAKAERLFGKVIECKDISKEDLSNFVLDLMTEKPKTLEWRRNLLKSGQYRIVKANDNLFYKFVAISLCSIIEEAASKDDKFSEVMQGLLGVKATRTAAEVLSSFILKGNEAAKGLFDQYVLSPGSVEKTVVVHALTSHSGDNFFKGKLKEFIQSGEGALREIVAAVYKEKEIAGKAESAEALIEGMKNGYVHTFTTFEEFLSSELLSGFKNKSEFFTTLLESEISSSVVFNAISLAAKGKTPFFEERIKELFPSYLMKYNWVIGKLVLAAGSKHAKERNLVAVVFKSWLSEEEKDLETEQSTSILEALAKKNKQSREVLSQVLSFINLGKYKAYVKIFLHSLLKDGWQRKEDVLEILKSFATVLGENEELASKERSEIFTFCLVEAVKTNSNTVGIPLLVYASDYEKLHPCLESALSQLIRKQETREIAERYLDELVCDPRKARITEHVLFFLIQQRETRSRCIDYLKNYVLSRHVGKGIVTVSVLLSLIQQKETLDFGARMLAHVIYGDEQQKLEEVASEVLSLLTDLPADVDPETERHHAFLVAKVLFVLIQNEKTRDFSIEYLKEWTNSDNWARSFTSQVNALLWLGKHPFLPFKKCVETGLLPLVLQNESMRADGFARLNEHMRAEESGKKHVAFKAFLKLVTNKKTQPIVHLFLKQTDKDEILNSMISAAIEMLIVEHFSSVVFILDKCLEVGMDTEFVVRQLKTHVSSNKKDVLSYLDSCAESEDSKHKTVAVDFCIAFALDNADLISGYLRKWAGSEHEQKRFTAVSTICLSIGKKWAQDLLISLESDDGFSFKTAKQVWMFKIDEKSSLDVLKALQSPKNSSFRVLISLMQDKNLRDRVFGMIKEHFDSESAKKQAAALNALCQLALNEKMAEHTSEFVVELLNEGDVSSRIDLFSEFLKRVSDDRDQLMFVKAVFMAMVENEKISTDDLQAIIQGLVNAEDLDTKPVMVWLNEWMELGSSRALEFVESSKRKNALRWFGCESLEASSERNLLTNIVKHCTLNDVESWIGLDETPKFWKGENGENGEDAHLSKPIGELIDEENIPKFVEKLIAAISAGKSKKSFFSTGALFPVVRKSSDPVDVLVVFVDDRLRKGDVLPPPEYQELKK